MGYKLRHDGHYEDCALLDGDTVCTCQNQPQAARVPPEAIEETKGRAAIRCALTTACSRLPGETVRVPPEAPCKHNRMICYECIKLERSVVPEVTSKPAEPLHDRLLEAAKAVLVWYAGDWYTHIPIEEMKELTEAIEAIEKEASRKG